MKVTTGQTGEATTRQPLLKGIATDLCSLHIFPDCFFSQVLIFASVLVSAKTVRVYRGILMKRSI